MDTCPLEERPMLGKKRKEGNKRGGIRPEAATVLHVEEVGNGMMVHAMVSIARKHGVPCNYVPHGHFGEDVGCRAESGAPDVQVDEGGGDKQVSMEAHGGGVGVDGSASTEVSERGACLEDEGEGVLVGGHAKVEHRAVKVDGGVEGAAPGVSADERVVSARVRRGDSVKHLAGKGQLPAGDVLLQLLLPFFIVFDLVRDGAGGRPAKADGGGGEGTEMTSREAHGASARERQWRKGVGLDDAATRRRWVSGVVVADA